MPKKKKRVVVLLISIFLLVFILGILFYYSQPRLTGRVILNYSDFKVHWNHMPITYNFEIIPSKNGYYVCPDSEKDRLKKAFDLIENKTNGLVLFNEVSSSGDIKISCYGKKITSSFFAGFVVNDGESNYQYQEDEIISATLSFYGQNDIQNNNRNCLDLELHEIFHIFGFEHNKNRNSIMYSSQWGPCKYKIDDYIIEKLKNTYQR